MYWTTQQAAEACKLTASGFRTLAQRARAAGVELQAPRRTWPNGRTPLYDGHAVFAYLASRPGQGNHGRRADRPISDDSAPPVTFSDGGTGGH